MVRRNVYRDQTSTFAAPLVVLQAINTMWTKASRGAPRAALRRAVPDVLPVPSIPDPIVEPSLLHHLVKYGERDDFGAPFAVSYAVQRFLAPVYQHNIALTPVDETVCVELN